MNLRPSQKLLAELRSIELGDPVRVRPDPFGVAWQELCPKCERAALQGTGALRYCLRCAYTVRR